MAINVIESFDLAIVFVGIVISIIELGLVLFIWRTKRVRNSNLTYLFALTALWTVYLLLHSIGERFDLPLVIISQVIGGGTIVAFTFVLPKLLRFYHKPLLIIAGVFALLSLVLDVIADNGGEALRAMYPPLLIIPPLLGYVLFMEAAIRHGR